MKLGLPCSLFCPLGTDPLAPILYDFGLPCTQYRAELEAQMRAKEEQKRREKEMSMNEAQVKAAKGYVLPKPSTP